VPSNIKAHYLFQMYLEYGCNAPKCSKEPIPASYSQILKYVVKFPLLDACTLHKLFSNYLKYYCCVTTMETSPSSSFSIPKWMARRISEKHGSQRFCNVMLHLFYCGMTEDNGFALLKAVQLGSLNIVSLLLEHGFSPNKRSSHAIVVAVQVRFIRCTCIAFLVLASLLFAFCI
jgi:hypothetical protein